MPRCSYPTVLSMIDVNDPDIMNIMIDMFNIESTILIRDAKEARSVMGNKPPYNARNVSIVAIVTHVAIVTVAIVTHVAIYSHIEWSVFMYSYGRHVM